MAFIVDSKVRYSAKRLMSGQVIQDWEPLDHPLVTQLTVHCNYVIVNTVDTGYGGRVGNFLHSCSFAYYLLSS
jgi:hypothetical protein